MPIPELRRIAALVAATVNHLRVEMAALGEEGDSFHPAPGEWCAKEVIGHLIEADRRGFTGRVEAILAADTPPLEAWDQQAVSASRDDCTRSAVDLIDEFAEVRRVGLAQLERIAAADLSRAGIHPQVGEMTVSDILHEWPFHDRDHLRQILTNTRALLWPRLGAAQRFSEQRDAGI